MAREIIRNPQALPLSSYSVREASFGELPSGYRGLITLPGYISRDLSPDSIDISSPLTKYRPGKNEPAIRLNIPVISAAMQSVSGQKMGIALARLGGLAAIYCSQTIEEEADMIKAVKRHKGAFIEPEVVSPEDTIEYVAERMERTGYSKFFVTRDGVQHGMLLGLVTDNDFDAEMHKGQKVMQRMRPVRELDVVYNDEVSHDVKKANERAKSSHHSALPVIYSDGRLRDVIFRRDIRDHREHKTELIDDMKRLRVIAAVNTHDYEDRIPAVADSGADLILIDTSQGWTDHLADTSHFALKKYPGIPVIGGNVVTAEGFNFLVRDCGVDSVKVGMGIASICITPKQIGITRSQDRAIEEVTKARDKHLEATGEYVPIIADGGIRSVRDMVVALALGADSVMAGKFFAGTNESPTEINYKFSPPRKPYWGEGSDRAKSWRENRGYSIEFEEGVPNAGVDYVGPLEPYISQAMEQLRQGIRKAGCRTIDGLHRNAVVETISEEEVGAHGVHIEKK